jgi:hypothetical protein
VQSQNGSSYIISPIPEFVCMQNNGLDNARGCFWPQRAEYLLIPERLPSSCLRTVAAITFSLSLRVCCACPAGETSRLPAISLLCDPSPSLCSPLLSRRRNNSLYPKPVQQRKRRGKHGKTGRETWCKTTRDTKRFSLGVCREAPFSIVDYDLIHI